VAEPERVKDGDISDSGADLQRVDVTNVRLSWRAVILSSSSTCMLVRQHDAVFCRWNTWEFPVG